jgi:hypothetical protein
MSWTYRCPKCGAMLNPDQTVVLVASQGARKLLIGFHPEPGNFDVYLPPDVTLAEGEHWDFHCPVCRENLRSGEVENLCELRMAEQGRTHRVFFSRVAGEHATFLVSEPEPEASANAKRAEQAVAEGHGEHAHDYAGLIQMKYLL